jgi:regulator of sirC expression with transglutaminase-like and TPR domain
VPTPSARLDALLRHPGPVPLDRAFALISAVEQPGVDDSELIVELDLLAHGLHLRPEAPLVEHVARLHHHLFTVHGFLGEEAGYDEPQSSFLDHALTHRRGLPITLSVVYIEVARRVGLEVDAIGFPGHFLVSPRPTDDTPRFYVDPFHAGRIRRDSALRDQLQRLEVPAEAHDTWLTPVDTRAVVLRISHNLRASYVRRRRYADALRQADRMLLLEPSRAEHHRVRGLLLQRLGAGPEAAAALERFLQLEPDAEDRSLILQLVEQLRG